MPRMFCASCVSLGPRFWRWRGFCRLGAGLIIAAGIVAVVSFTGNIHAQSLGPLVSADASCSTLAAADRTATNGSTWGETILPGHDQPGGWFGVDVCSNGINTVTGDSSSVSCDRVPDNWSQTNCAPGEPTSDGYGWTFQCPELVVRFSAWAFGDSPAEWGRSGWGNAPDLWTSANHPPDFVAYANGSSEPPVPGDILVWGSLDSQGEPWPAGPDGEHGGHVAVVAAVTNGFVVTAEQNVTWGDQDHPSDRLALTKVGDRWILSGSQVPATQLPTYRWQSTMGDSRATYGWLHSIRNTGHFPSSSVAVRVAGSTAGSKGTTLPQQPSGGLPALDTTTMITSNGELADLVWSDSDFFDPSAAAEDVPHAALRSLGAPPGTLLMVGEHPATIMLSDGSRMSYAVGIDGQLYVLDLTPTVLGAVWTGLGHPDATLLAGQVSASTFAGGLSVVALGKDGNLWWRTGVVNQPGTWQKIGKPSGTKLTGNFVLAGAPGQGVPLIVALGANGLLYDRVWIDAQFAADGSMEVPAGWGEWSRVSQQPPNVAFSGTLVATTEMANSADYIGSWPDTPLDICVLDTSGRLWWLRITELQSGWQISPVAGHSGLSALLGGTVVEGSAAAGDPQQPAQLLQVYAAASGRSDMISLLLPANRTALSPKGDWTSLSPMPPGVSVQSGGAAVATGQNASVVAVVSGHDVLLGGTASALSLLLPAASSSGSWPSAGSNATEPAFADSLTGQPVDSRWAVSGTGTELTATTRGLQLRAGTGGSIAMLQTADAGEFELSVHVSLPARTGGKAGLVLYTDDNDWLTLLLDPEGQISLCVEAWQRALPCTTRTLPESAVANGVWLRVARRGDHFAGAASVDEVTWQPVGSWTPPSGTNSGPVAISGGEPLSSLAFTTWGILTQGSVNDRASAWFSDFAMVN